MNTNLTDKILQTIDYSGNLIKEGIDFTKEQAPLVVQEFLTWEFWNSFGTGVLLLIISLTFLSIGWKYRKLMWGELAQKTDGFTAMANVCIFAIALGLLIPMTFNFQTALKVKIAPRVYLIEWASNQVKN